MRKGKFKFTNNQGTEEQVALETLLSQVIDSPIRALERSSKYVEGEVALFKSFSKGFLVCVKSGTTQPTLPSTYSNINADYVNITDGTAIFNTRLFKTLVNKESPIFSGKPSAPTPTSNSNDNTIATTEFVQAVLMEGLKNIDLSAYLKSADAKTIYATIQSLSNYLKTSDAKTVYAPINSPSFQGQPKSVTPASSSNDTSIATTAFVLSKLANSGGGIVASNLAQNGYVKFANGLILQWGTLNARYGTFTYPITLKSVFAISMDGIINGRDSSMSGHGLQSVSNTSVYCYGGATQFTRHYIIVIGI